MVAAFWAATILSTDTLVDEEKVVAKMPEFWYNCSNIAHEEIVK